MANIQSQIKRNRQNERRRLRNKAVRAEVKTAEKAARQAVEGGDADQAGAALESASRLLDKAVRKGVVHKRTAARRKSRLAKRVQRPS